MSDARAVRATQSVPPRLSASTRRARGEARAATMDEATGLSLARATVADGAVRPPDRAGSRRWQIPSRASRPAQADPGRDAPTTTG